MRGLLDLQVCWYLTGQAVGQLDSTQCLAGKVDWQKTAAVLTSVNDQTGCEVLHTPDMAGYIPCPACFVPPPRLFDRILAQAEQQTAHGPRSTLTCLVNLLRSRRLQ